MQFDRLASTASLVAGQAATFSAAVLVVAVWALVGPVFGFSDTWQLVINTSTTIVTFLMVFLLQNTQNRDTRELKQAISELVRAIPAADNDKAPTA